MKAINSIYFHIPFCVSRCHYCIFPIHAQGKSSDALHISSLHKTYFEILKEELTFTLKKLQVNEKSELKTLYFGGGTPSLFPLQYYELLFEQLRKFYSITEDCEITIELDPGTFNEEKINGFKALGVNRISLGVQTFDEALLTSMNRSHNLKDTYRAIEMITSSGFGNVSLDIIMNFPNETESIWENNLNNIKRLLPDHLSIYSLILEPESNLVRKFGFREDKNPWKSQEESADRYRRTNDFLSILGYDHYEISSFCRNGKLGKHNQVYWEGDSEFLAFGMGASSLVNRRRLTRPKTIRSYAKYVEKLKLGLLKPEDLGEPEESVIEIAKSVVMGKLRTSKGLKLTEVVEKTGVPMETVRKMFESFVEMNWDLHDKLEFNGEALRLSIPEGFLFNDEVTVRLFLHLERSLVE